MVRLNSLVPRLSVAEVPHSSLKSVDKTVETQLLSPADLYQGPELRVSTWGVLSAQSAYSVRRAGQIVEPNKKLGEKVRWFAYKSDVTEALQSPWHEACVAETTPF